MPRVLPSQVVQLIENYFPVVKNQTGAQFTLDRSHRNSVVSIAQAIEYVPVELLSPPTSQDYIDLIANIGILKFTLDSWKTPYVGSVDSLTSSNKPNPISVLHDVLLKCSDQIVSPAATGLEFLDDDDLRYSLRIDLTTVKSAMTNGEWKAATVLAGATAEALLLWALGKAMTTRKAEIDTAATQQVKKNKRGDLNEWDLDEYNKVARQIDLISDKTFRQIDLAREFRNYIHPGAQIRKNSRCTAATAYSSIAAVELLAEDLSAKLHKA